MRPSTLYVVRHGLAVAVGASGVSTDRDRYLSDEGKGVMKLEGRALRAMGVAPGAILSSPYARAEETAQILRGELSFPGAVATSDLLEPSANPILVTQLLQSHPVESIMVVGHAPTMEELCVFLVSGRERGDPFIRLRAGGVACLQFADILDAGRGVLEWLLTPEQLIKCAAHTGGK